MQLPIKSNIKSTYGFFLFAMIDEVSSSYKLHMSCSFHMENFLSFEHEVSLQTLCDSNIIGWASPISLIIFLVRSSIHSHVRVALPPLHPLLLNPLLLPLFYLKTRDLVASNIRKPSTFLAFVIDWDTLLASTFWPHCSFRSKHLRHCFRLYLNLFLCTTDDLSP